MEVLEFIGSGEMDHSTELPSSVTQEKFLMFLYAAPTCIVLISFLLGGLVLDAIRRSARNWRSKIGAVPKRRFYCKFLNIASVCHNSFAVTILEL